MLRIMDHTFRTRITHIKWSLTILLIVLGVSYQYVMVKYFSDAVAADHISGLFIILICTVLVFGILEFLERSFVEYALSRQRFS